MTNSNDKKIACWLDKTEVVNIDPLGRVVIEDEEVLEAIAGGISKDDMDSDDIIFRAGAFCHNGTC